MIPLCQVDFRSHTKTWRSSLRPTGVKVIWNYYLSSCHRSSYLHHWVVEPSYLPNTLGWHYSNESNRLLLLIFRVSDQRVFIFWCNDNDLLLHREVCVYFRRVCNTRHSRVTVFHSRQGEHFETLREVSDRASQWVLFLHCFYTHRQLCNERLILEVCPRTSKAVHMQIGRGLLRP